jgi:pimeloyl-ACP methyl ester carboxylesterase
MSIVEGWADHHGVRIHLLTSGHPSDPRPPLVVVPGMCQPAEAFARPIAGAVDRRCVFVSLRGRGHSDAPVEGYTYEDQLSDVLAVVDHLGLERFWLLGHSVGVAFALGVAARLPARVAGLILSDYPPHYPPFDEAWAARVLQMPRLPMPAHAVHALAREARRVVLTDQLASIGCPVLLTRGSTEGSLLPEPLAEIYTRHLRHCRVEILHGIGHEPLQGGGQPFLSLLRSFLAEQELTARIHL